MPGFVLHGHCELSPRYVLWVHMLSEQWVHAEPHVGARPASGAAPRECRKRSREVEDLEEPGRARQKRPLDDSDGSDASETLALFGALLGTPLPANGVHLLVYTGPVQEQPSSMQHCRRHALRGGLRQCDHCTSSCA